jgi:hypothetical protein
VGVLNDLEDAGLIVRSRDRPIAAAASSS